MNIEQSVKKLQRPQARVMLDILGVPMRDHPSKVADMYDAIAKLGKAMPEEFEKAFNLIVKGEMPKGTDQSMAVDVKTIIAAMNDHVSHLEREVASNLRDVMRQEAKNQSDQFVVEARKVIDDAKKQFVTHQVKVGNKKPKKIKGTPPKQFKKLLQLAQARKNILMVGPSGCGKTHVAAMIADALDMEFAAQSCSVGVSESNFVGWLLPTGNNGKFNHVVSSFLKLYENGGVFLVDEMDNADPNLLVFLNMALANDRFYLPQRFNNPEVKRHPDFVCVAAANTFGGGADILYSSRNALDAATLDRFRMGTVQMDYDDDVEEALIENKTLLEWGRTMRTAIKNHNLAKLMSTRALIDAQDMMVDHDWDLHDCSEAYFADWSREEKMMVRDEIEHFYKNAEAA